MGVRLRDPLFQAPDPARVGAGQVTFEVTGSALPFFSSQARNQSERFVRRTRSVSSCRVNGPANFG